MFRKKKHSTDPNPNENEGTLKTIQEELSHVSKPKTSKRRDVRVKFEYNGEKRSTHMRRPVRLHSMREKALNIFSHIFVHSGEFYLKFNVNYSSDASFILETQEHLDRALEILTTSIHIKSLPISLVAYDEGETSSSQQNFQSHANTQLQKPPDKLRDLFEYNNSSERQEKHSLHDSRNQHCQISPKINQKFSTPTSPSDCSPDYSPSIPSSSSTTSDDRMTTLGWIGHGGRLRGTAYSNNRGVDIESHTSTDSGWASGSRQFYPMGSVRSARSDPCDGGFNHETNRRFARTISDQKDSLSSKERNNNHKNLDAKTSPSSISQHFDRISLKGTACSPKIESPKLASTVTPCAPRNWRKGAPLGSGAFGVVYIAYDLDSGRQLAVKEVNIEMRGKSNTGKEIRALEKEMEILKSLKHNRIVQYYGFHKDSKHLCIFMEFMPGGSVKDEISACGRLPEKTVRKYTRHIIEGVDFLHKNLIVHRDIKGANVLKTVEGDVKLADFGASKRLQTITNVNKTLIGTPNWISPEVIDGKGYGRKADIWSIGCTVVEMLTGHPPWHGLEPMAVLFKIVTEPVAQYTLPENSTPEAIDFVRWTLHKMPEDRPSAGQLLRHHFVTL